MSSCSNYTQSTTTAHANHNAFITTNQGAAAPLTNYQCVTTNLTWYIDSRAISHVSQDAGIFLSCSIYICVEKLHIRNGLGLHIKHVRIAAIKTLNSTDIYLTNVLHVPTITKNLLNVSRLSTDNNAILSFKFFFILLRTRA